MMFRGNLVTELIHFTLISKYAFEEEFLSKKILFFTIIWQKHLGNSIHEFPTWRKFLELENPNLTKGRSKKEPLSCC